VLGGRLRVGYVLDRGDSGVQCRAGAEHVADIEVAGPHRGADLSADLFEVVHQRRMRCGSTKPALPHVPVGVDEPGKYETAGGVDLLDLPRRSSHVFGDGADAAVLDEHVATRQVSDRVVHGQHPAVAHEDRTRVRVGHHRLLGSSRPASDPALTGECMRGNE